MKMRWVFLATTVLLTGIWYFRWNEATILNLQHVTTVHKVDRWTGQAWIHTYTLNWSHEKPVIDDDDFYLLLKEVTSNDVLLTLQSEQDDERQKNEGLARLQRDNNKYVAEYLRLGNDYRRILMEPYYNKKLNSQWYPPFSECMVQWGDMNEKAERAMPPDVVEGYNAYCDAKAAKINSDEKLLSLETEISTESTSNQSVAERRVSSQLTEQIWKKRKRYTKTWQCVLFVVSSLTLFSFSITCIRRQK